MLFLELNISASRTFAFRAHREPGHDKRTQFVQFELDIGDMLIKCLGARHGTHRNFKPPNRVNPFSINTSLILNADVLRIFLSTGLPLSRPLVHGIGTSGPR